MFAAMQWTMLDTWIVAAGALSAMSCGLLGCFLVLRRMSMMGDAISHAVLPGLAMAFLLTQSRDSLAMFLGAAIIGVMTALFTQWIHRFGKVEQSAAMGVTFTILFAIGLVLIVQAADTVDLDPGCVLYGAIELIPLNTRAMFGHEIPIAVVSLSAVFLLIVAFTLLFYKELKITSFDPALATAQGFNAGLMHYTLMTLVAVATVASFESVGSILVIAMLIVPAATAHLLVERLAPMLLLSLAFGAASAALGHVAAILVPPWFGFTDTNTAGMIAVVAGAFFFAALALAPRQGVLSKAATRIALTLRIAREDALGLLYRMEEQGRAMEALSRDAMARFAGVPPFAMRLALAELTWRGDVRRRDGRLRLTERGREDARQLIRSHRLWETYLGKYLDLPSDRVHGSAERLEHVGDDDFLDQLEDRVGHPTHDPHGLVIPPDFVDVRPGQIASLSVLREGRDFTIETAPTGRRPDLRPGECFTMRPRRGNNDVWAIRRDDGVEFLLTHEEADSVQVRAHAENPPPEKS